MQYLNPNLALVTDLDPTSENGQLFLAELILLTEYKQASDWNGYTSLFNFQLRQSFADVGLYHRNPILVDRRIMSHDNLSGIFSVSFLKNTAHRHTIWKYLLKHLGTYDNSQGKSSQLSRFLPFNPSNFFIWGLCADSYIYLLFFPIYLISLVISCGKPATDTSGKILSWVEMFPHRNHWLVKHIFKYYEKKMKVQYGELYIEALMKIYHGNNSPEFPINKLLSNG